MGIRQFLDIGPGLPTINTHHIAQALTPQCRIVYVDHDPLVVAHARALLTSTPEGVTAYLDVDLREPEKILQHAAGTLDFTRPVALLLEILSHITEDHEAHAIVTRLLDAVPAGSYLVLSHPTAELHREAMLAYRRLWNECATPPITTRSSQQITCFFGSLQLLGVVSAMAARSRPDRHPGRGGCVLRGRTKANDPGRLPYPAGRRRCPPGGVAGCVSCGVPPQVPTCQGLDRRRRR